MSDSLGDRMKAYEKNTQNTLIRRLPAVIRLDGRAFHTFTKNYERPFCSKFSFAMRMATLELLQDISTAVMAYVQSDEISVLLCDFKNLESQQWFGGNIQKIVSVSSSVVTTSFNDELPEEKQRAHFDSRVFSLPTADEVANYFYWRWKDCTRNSVSMLAQHMFSHKELHGISTEQMKEKLRYEVNRPWEDENPIFKDGTLYIREDGQWVGRSVFPDIREQAKKVLENA